MLRLLNDPDKPSDQPRRSEPFSSRLDVEDSDGHSRDYNKAQSHIDHSNLVCGGGITIGNKFTRCMGNHGTPDIRAAITRSCDGYFYRLGLKMGIDGIVAMVDEFDLNKRTGIDLPTK